jgi:hypothetical protein
MKGFAAAMLQLSNEAAVGPLRERDSQLDPSLNPKKPECLNGLPVCGSGMVGRGTFVRREGSFVMVNGYPEPVRG